MNVVSIYIYTNTQFDTSLFKVNDFITRVGADSGTFESKACMISLLDSYGGFTETTPTSKRLDLFNDEKISVTSSVSNYNDIGKIYTDFSQSFTIPASKKNNKVLSHWYESQIDNGYDHRKRYDAYIEIDSVLFKKGNIQLEKTNKKNGFIESYTVTFYGNLTQLKDKFKDDKLNTLDFNSLNHTYNSTNIINRINPTSSFLVNYPLIGSAKKYYYKEGVSTDDINNTAGAIKWDELFPSVPLWRIFEFIQTKYGVTFTGSFFNLDQFFKLELYLKNQEKIIFQSERLEVDFNAVSIGPFPQLNLTTNELTTDWAFATAAGRLLSSLTSDVFIYPDPAYINVNYTVFIYKDNLLFRTYQCIGNSQSQLDRLQYVDTLGVRNTYKIFVSSNSTFVFNSKLDYQISYLDPPSLSLTRITLRATGPLQTTISKINIGTYVPDITINDFLTGIIKAFNLMIIPTDINTFEFLPLEMYYNAGKVLDITQYVYADEMEIERPKLFKAINFQYEKSNNILNNAFRGLYNREYGDLIYTNTNSNESANYDIKLPFENVLFEKTRNYPFETASLIDKDLKPYTPKPMLIYNNGMLPTALTTGNKIYVTTESTNVQIDNYIRFSNEYNSVPTDLTYNHLMSMNFGNEQSPWYNVLAPRGLYFRHYKNYVDNLYNIKTRVVKCKALFPTSLLNSSVKNSTGKSLGIALNDRLIIRNKRYIINNITTDLTTGETDLELITDYRGLDAANSVGYRFASFDTVQVNNTAQVVNEILYLNDYDSFDIKASTGFLSYTPTLDNITDFELQVTIPQNTSGLDRSDVIGIEYYKNDTLQKTEYINFIQTAI